MDFLKKVAGGVSGKKPATATEGQKDDYGDKAANFLDKKFAGGKIGKDNMEKVTDGLRQGYEKATGKKVDPKYSN